jgi:hypothetical protein
MVKVGGTALRLVVDAAFVELEGWLRSIDGNAHGLLSNSDLKDGFITTREVLVRVDVGTLVGSVVSTGERASGLIRIAGFGIHTGVVDDILEGAVHLTSLATFVAVTSGTIDEVLFRKAHQLLGGKEVDSLHGTGGRKRPARPALTLILDGSHRT